MVDKLKFPKENSIGDMKNQYPIEAFRFCLGGGVASGLKNNNNKISNPGYCQNSL
jgi:hypothetical protein